MAQPTPYVRKYDFEGHSTDYPTTPQPGVQIEAELDAVKVTTDETLANLALIQRDDGKLANRSVHLNALTSETLVLLELDAWNIRGAWVTATAYALDDLVTINDATYIAIVAHTSAAAFITDLAAGKWLVIANAAIDTISPYFDTFSGDGTTNPITLANSYTNEEDILLFVDGAIYRPDLDYTLSGDQITPTAVWPTTAANNIVVYGAGNVYASLVSGAQSALTSAQSAAAAAAASQTAAAASATSAAGSATNAATSATASAASASSASSRATAAATSASSAAASAAAAALSANPTAVSLALFNHGGL